MAESPNRAPKGIPSGGQFATVAKAEPGFRIDLSASNARRQRYARLAQAHARQLAEDASHAELATIAEEVREQYPEAKQLTFGVNDDDLWGALVTDQDGNDLPEASDFLQGKLDQYEVDDMAAFTDDQHDIDDMLAWEPESGFDCDDPFPQAEADREDAALTGPGARA